jgi:hypothetical protein
MLTRLMGRGWLVFISLTTANKSMWVNFAMANGMGYVLDGGKVYLWRFCV